MDDEWFYCVQCSRFKKGNPFRIYRNGSKSCQECNEKTQKAMKIRKEGVDVKYKNGTLVHYSPEQEFKAKEKAIKKAYKSGKIPPFCKT